MKNTYKLQAVCKACPMAGVGIYSDIWPQPSGNPFGSALRTFFALMLYLIVNPSFRQNTDTLLNVFLYKEIKKKKFLFNDIK